MLAVALVDMSPADQPRRARRREFVAGAGGLATALVAGCLSDTEPNQPGTTTDPAESSDPDESSSPETADSGPAASTTDWPTFGANARNTGYRPDAIGPGVDAQLAWRYDAGTPTLNASPVVSDGTVYVPGSGDPGYVHAVEADTGERVWRFEPAGYATCAPAVGDDALFFGTWGKRFYSLDPQTGREHWSTEVGHRFGTSSPVVVDGTVYVGTIGDGPLVVSGADDEEEFEACAVLAFDAESGDLEWDYRAFGERENVETSPAVADGRVHVAGEWGARCLDATSGEEVWSRDLHLHPESSPALEDGLVYYGAPVLSGDSESPARVWALDATSGETVWTAGIDDISLRTSPAVADGTVYVAASQTRTCTGTGECSGTTRGRIYALDAATGDREWTAPIETDTRSAPAVADGVVYAGCNDGVSAVTTDGDPAWHLGFESDREDGPYVDSAPAIANDRLFLGASDGRLRAIEST
jgi:outer membrane protein assembly factor BamB